MSQVCHNFITTPVISNCYTLTKSQIAVSKGSGAASWRLSSHMARALMINEDPKTRPAGQAAV